MVLLEWANICTFNDVSVYDFIAIFHDSTPVVAVLSQIHPHSYTVFEYPS
jgi:hypothetical protein